MIYCDRVCRILMQCGKLAIYHEEILTKCYMKQWVTLVRLSHQNLTFFYNWYEMDLLKVIRCGTFLVYFGQSGFK